MSLDLPSKSEEQRKVDRAAWFARREERREKQRAQNLVRAEKMHAARIEYERDHPREKHATPPAAIHVGCSGWFYWHWRECFYPTGLPGKDWFTHYASQFDTVELNAPFYSWPTLATVATWKRQCGRKRFVYAIKVNELITHTKRFVRCKTLVRDFGLIADLLGKRFGCFLFQLPPSYRYSARALKQIVGSLDHTRKNVVEFRHKSWWNEKVFAAFRAHGTIFCSVSGPRLPSDFVKTADEVYVRFHGLKQWYRHDYSREELQTWADAIRASRAKTVWAYFNNDREGYAIKNARELIKMLKRRGQLADHGLRSPARIQK